MPPLHFYPTSRSDVQTYFLWGAVLGAWLGLDLWGRSDLDYYRGRPAGWEGAWWISGMGVLSAISRRFDL